MELVIATSNNGKFEELRAGLKALPFTLLSLKDFPRIPEAPETGETFSEIAHNKAQYYFDSCSADVPSASVLAEDSGLLIPSLDDFPGIFSARIAKTDKDRIRMVLEKLHAVADRSAYYHCSMIFLSNSQKIETTGRCDGLIVESPRGKLGFGYDPIFLPDNSDRTFGEMSLSEKAIISHRGRALQEMIPRLRKDFNL